MENNSKILDKEVFETIEFREFFLYNFIKQLIRHSGGTEVLELGKIIEEEIPIKNKITPIKKEVNIQSEYVPSIKLKEITQKQPIQVAPNFQGFQKSPARRMIPRILRIPEPRLPPRLQYLRPIPRNIDIDLGKINPLIKDNLVNSIECNGENQPLIVKGKMGIKTSNIILNKEEIGQILRRFSREAKIPLHEGVTKIVLGNLILSAIMSEEIGSKFIIRKMILSPPKPTPRPMRRF